MKSGYALALVLGGSAALSGLVFDPPAKFIWNRTASAPEGLYWLRDEPFTKGRWVVLSARSGPAQWAEARGYVGKDWPLLKRVSGVSGDEICRKGVDVFINDELVAKALLSDEKGRDLPAWDGCVTLRNGELFLLSPHPSSLDGRYFGAVREADILGVAVPLMVSSVHGLSAE
jgi:conjugative transfer signal peptidase TraF